MLWGRLLLFALVFYLLWKLLFPRRRGDKRTGRRGGTKASDPEEMKQDPVCGTWVPVSQAHRLETKTKGTLYFCSPACRDRYRSEPPCGDN